LRLTSALSNVCRATRGDSKGERIMLRKSMFAAAFCAVAIASASASAAFAGEITGNGTLKAVNGNSPCAFSGQEDLQWYTNDGDTTLRSDPTKGDPAHSQNWGHVKQETGALGGANSTDAFGFPWGCNAHIYGLKSGNTGP